MESHVLPVCRKSYILRVLLVHDPDRIRCTDLKDNDQYIHDIVIGYVVQKKYFYYTIIAFE